MNRMDRLFAILIHLQSKRITTAKEIADNFHISIRTVYRDIRALEEAGIPIGAEAGLGYYLVEGYYLPPVMFTSQEASALITAEKFIESYTDNSIREDFKKALQKIKAVLKRQDQDLLERIYDKVEVYHSLGKEVPTGNGYMAAIQNALSNRKVISILYTSAGSPQTISRSIEPLAMGFFEMHWHLIAFCRLRKEYRDFRVDRIKKVDITKETFPDSKHGSLMSILKEMLEYKHLRQVTLQFDKSIPYDLIKNKCILGLTEEKDLGDKTELTMWSDSLEVLGKLLLGYASGVDIISPPELKMIMRDYAEAIAEKYL